MPSKKTKTTVKKSVAKKPSKKVTAKKPAKKVSAKKPRGVKTVGSNVTVKDGAVTVTADDTTT